MDQLGTASAGSEIDLAFPQPPDSGQPVNGLSGDSRFHTTLWSMVLRAGAGDEAPKQAALDELCRLYWRPLFVFCLGRKLSREDAEDLTQGFFAYLLTKDTLRLADPARGRFRSFLLSSFKNYIAGDGDHRRAAKRGGGAIHISFDLNFECPGLLPPSDELTPELIYDRQWARDLVARATDSLRLEMESSGKGDWFDKVAGPGANASYGTVAVELGSTEEAVKSFAKRTRRRFRELLKVAIADTVASPDEAGAEMAYLANLLRG